MVFLSYGFYLTTTRGRRFHLIMCCASHLIFGLLEMNFQSYSIRVTTIREEVNFLGHCGFFQVSPMFRVLELNLLHCGLFL